MRKAIKNLTLKDLTSDELDNYLDSTRFYLKDTDKIGNQSDLVIFMYYDLCFEIFKESIK